MPVEFFDTHAHLTDPRFDGEREALIASLPGRGVTRVVDVACDVRVASATLDLLDKYDFLYAAVGMHPHEAGETTLAHLDETARLLKLPKVVALGEIGLDYHYDFAPREVQKKWFAAQLELANQLNVPVSLHIREAFGDCMDILRANRQGLKGVMHCFSGSKEIAFECLDLGLYIAFGGALTFNNANKLVQAAAALPLERLVLETDCPYMTPVPFRGKRNDPSLISHTAAKLAELKGLPVFELAAILYQNSMNLFELTCLGQPD